MDYGKTNRVPEHLYLPESDPKNSFLNQSHSDLKVFVGGPVWADPKWKGSLYPPNTTSGEFLKVYGEKLNTVEVNSTYYNRIAESTIKSWCAKVPKDFKFFVKWPKEISHERQLLRCEALALEFLSDLDHFGENLGVSFLQMPPGFGEGYKTRLFSLIELIREKDHRPFAVELRHPSWLDQGGHLKPEVFDFFKAFQISAVTIDTLGARDVLHTSVPSGPVVVRFLGHGDKAVDDVRIAQWAERLEQWVQQGAREVFFYGHLTDNTDAPKLVVELIKQFKSRFATDLSPLQLYQPDQLKLF